MRKRTGIFSVLFAAAALCMASAASAAVSVSVSFFHDQLAPHGRWVAAGSYGNCWVPSGVAAGWEPYVDGQWVDSDYGWTWVSDDPWGDIPYHYGTWAYADPYGWVWVPGTVWAPAWVTWAYTDDFVGWAPVPPSFALTATGYYGSPVVVTATHYVFVPTRQFVGVPVASVRVPTQQSVALVPRAVKTTRFEVNHGVVRVAGPPAARVEHAVGHAIPRVAASSLRVRPTTLSAAGVTQAKSIRVVAPAKERERAAAAPAAVKENRAERPETATARAEGKPKAAPKHEAAAPREAAARPKAEPKPQLQTKPKEPAVRPQNETRQANVEHARPAPKPKPKPKVENRAEPNRESQKPEQPKAEAPSHDVSRQANAEHAQPAPRAKPRPQAQRPPPPKEKPQPPKDKDQE
jgi:hypothetical protein